MATKKRRLPAIASAMEGQSLSCYAAHPEPVEGRLAAPTEEKYGTKK
jgi:hypothetical protein